MPFPPYTPCAPVFVRHLAERFGERCAMLEDERRVSYAALESESARMARGLMAAGVGKGTRVGLLLPNGPDWVIACLAAARIGALVVPINTFYQARELGWVLRHADVHTLVCADRLQNHDYPARLEECAPGLAARSGGPLWLASHPFLRQVFVLGEGRRPWARDAAELWRGDAAVDDALLRAAEAEVTPADAMLLIYSSGSTAEPKGAVHSHGAVLRHSFNLAAARDIGPDDRVWSPMPYFWVGGLVFGLLGSLQVGACLLSQRVFEPGATLELLERERATVAGAWPHYGKLLAEHPDARRRDLSSLRSGNLYELMRPGLRPADPALRANALGMTETCGPHTWGEGDVPERLRGSFGQPVEGVEHRVVDPVSGEPLPPGEEGELCVRGYNVMQGLYKREREEVFDADGFFHTGDGGRFDPENYLYFTGRLGELIKTGGASVAPAEIEQVLARIPGVKQGFAVGVPHPTRGQNVAVAVLLEPGATLEERVLLERLRKDLASYKVPRHVFFYEHAALPWTDSGKIDKRRLTAELGARLAEEAG